MHLLLDTHAFIWFAEDDNNLASNIKKEIEFPQNTIYLSIASIWEIAIKMQLNKVSMNRSIEEILELTAQSSIEIMPILPEHIIKLTKLDFHHRDPFDRIIIAQGLEENLKIVSKDSIFSSYGVDVIW
ncbi:MAG: type II toxin-antitoxin system VapC family toxin [Cyclobacteriaceae bacterium]